jgi:16S rRNA processing protein RimM
MGRGGVDLMPPPAVDISSLHFEEIQAPAHFLEIGWISGASGLKGAVRVELRSGDTQTLDSITDFWLQHQNRWFVAPISGVAARSGGAVVTFDGVVNRNQSELLRGARVCLARERLPAPEKDAYYWVDLVDCSVTNTCGAVLGKVGSLLSTGAHDVLCILDPRAVGGQRMIPFVDAFVKSVDLTAKTIVVDWQPEWDEA